MSALVNAEAHNMMQAAHAEDQSGEEMGDAQVNGTDMSSLCAELLDAAAHKSAAHGGMVESTGTGTVLQAPNGSGLNNGGALVIAQGTDSNPGADNSKGSNSLEGEPVYYKGKNGEVVLTGVLKNNGVLCNCHQCGGKEVISTTMFETHAGSTARRPGDNIILSDGQSLRMHKAMNNVSGTKRPAAALSGEAKIKKRRLVGAKAIKERRQQFLENIQTLLAPHMPPEALASLLEEARELMLTDAERHQRMAYRALAQRGRFRPLHVKQNMLRVAQAPSVVRSPTTPFRCGDRKAGHQCTGAAPPGPTPMPSIPKLASALPPVHSTSSGLSPLSLSSRKTSGRSLLSTGLLEGRQVTYRAANGAVMLTGAIKDTGVLCNCNECKGQKVVSLCNFEIHAGSTARHPTDNIYLDDGRTLRDHVNMHLLGEVGMAVKMEAPVKKDKTKSMAATMGNEVAKTRTRDMPGIFQSDMGVADGERLSYRVNGQDFLGGYKKGASILCDCCKCPVSPSQFEQHAGFGQRRRPYDAIVVLSRNMTLKQIGDSLKAHGQVAPLQAPSQQQAAGTPQEVCSICGQGGELLLCDSCPHVYHLRCVGLDHVPEGGNWHCPECITKKVDDVVMAVNVSAAQA